MITQSNNNTNNEIYNICRNAINDKNNICNIAKRKLNRNAIFI